MPQTRKREVIQVDQCPVNSGLPQQPAAGHHRLVGQIVGLTDPVGVLDMDGMDARIYRPQQLFAIGSDPQCNMTGCVARRRHHLDAGSDLIAVLDQR